MKRLHVSIAVRDLDESIRFYSVLFGAEPTVLKTDYAKWMLEDPRVNFSISSRDKIKGIDHLGIQVDDDIELAMLTERLARAGQSVHQQTATTCCYARSNKAWVHDPEGVAWEAFHTLGESATYSGNSADERKSSTCDTPRASRRSVCCVQNR
jgi:catechol 2,3-dioxygenase-like lactoylglutathione lyase family enzyme